MHIPLPINGNKSSPSSFAVQVDAYSDFLNKINIKKVAAMGFFAGGPSSREFAPRHPDKTLVLVIASAVVYEEPQ